MDILHYNLIIIPISTSKRYIYPVESHTINSKYHYKVSLWCHIYDSLIIVFRTKLFYFVDTHLFRYEILYSALSRFQQFHYNLWWNEYSLHLPNKSAILCISFRFFHHQIGFLLFTVSRQIQFSDLKQIIRLVLFISINLMNVIIFMQCRFLLPNQQTNSSYLIIFMMRIVVYQTVFVFLWNRHWFQEEFLCEILCKRWEMFYDDWMKIECYFLILHHFYLFNNELLTFFIRFVSMMQNLMNSFCFLLVSYPWVHFIIFLIDLLWKMMKCPMAHHWNLMHINIKIIHPVYLRFGVDFLSTERNLHIYYRHQSMKDHNENF